MRLLNRILWALFFLIFSVLPLSGCISGATSVSIQANFLTSVHLNPNIKGESSPIVVHYYELTSPTTFESSSFFTLTDPDSNVLGQDLLSEDEITLFPGEEKSISRKLHPSTRYIGFIAEYREIAQARWRAVIPVKARISAEYMVRLNKNTIAVSDMQTNNETPEEGATKFDF